MMRSLQRAILMLVVLNGWCLLGIILVDYLLGDILGLFSTSIYSQGWAILLLVALSFSSSLKATQLKLKQWYTNTPVDFYLQQRFGTCLAMISRALRALYINLYLLADVVFCVGAPLLIVSASTGWWLIDDVSYIALIEYCSIISIIVFVGLYSNMARLLSLGYFFGYWLLSDNMLLYPFVAPTLVQQNIAIMISQSLNSWILVVGLILIIYLMARRRQIDSQEATASGVGKISNVFSQHPFEMIKTTLNRELLGNYLSLACLIMAVPLGVLILNSIIGHLNTHLLFACFIIWMFDKHWQYEVVNEPALSSDGRYFVDLMLKH